jgi:hypothetical protein
MREKRRKEETNNGRLHKFISQNGRAAIIGDRE